MINLRTWLRDKAVASHAQSPRFASPVTWTNKPCSGVITSLGFSQEGGRGGRLELCPLFSETLNERQPHFLSPHVLPVEMRGRSFHSFICDGCWWQMLKWTHPLVNRQMSPKLFVCHRGRNFQSNLTFLRYRKCVPSQWWNLALSSSCLQPAHGWLTHSITLVCPRRDSGDHPAWTVITASPHSPAWNKFFLPRHYTHVCTHATCPNGLNTTLTDPWRILSEFIIFPVAGEDASR